MNPNSSRNNPTALTGRTALVTGASRGLGAAMARSLGAHGAKVAVNYFASPHLAEGVAAKICDAGGEAAAFRADVRDPEEIRRLMAEIAARFGPLDILVINATGEQPHIPLEDVTWQDCLDQLEFFVKSPLLLVQSVLASMKERKYGRVIQIGSEVFELGWPSFSSYVSAKGAQLGLTRSWARDLAPYGITVNMVSPGWIPTERHANDPQADKDAYAASTPMRHMGKHEDVGEAVAFLASDAAGYITGQKLAVNGGNTLA
jgi:3-oxoacyl-[acyl-carrier protein] reductase